MVTRPDPRRLAVLLFATSAPIAIATDARATTPPPPTYEDIVDGFRNDIKNNLQCPDLSREPGVFGNVEVRVTNDKLTVTASQSLGGRFASCVSKAVHAVFAGGYGFPSRLQEGRGRDPGGTVIELSFGTPRPNLPEPSRLLPAWISARRNDRPLRALLPPDITVTTDGCLRPDGSANREGVDLWLAQWAKRVQFPWWRFFKPASSPWLLDRRSIVVFENNAYCLLPLDEERESDLRSRLNAAGACWAGQVPDVLVAARAGFPADRRYRSVSIAKNRACAIDAAGGIVCCGSPRPPPPPKGAFKSVSVGEIRACAVRTDDTIACWSNSDTKPLPPFDGHYGEVVVGDGGACARRLDGGFDCRGNALDVTGEVRQVSLGAGGDCVVRRDGTLTCNQNSTNVPPPGPVIAVDRNYTICALIESGEVFCPQTGSGGLWGLVSRERFKDVTATQWGGCGRRQDDTVACWGRVPCQAPAGRFTSLDASFSHVCGVRDDGRIVCWGESNNGFSWTDFE